MVLRDYNKDIWVYQDKEYNVNELNQEQIIDFFVTTFLFVKSNPSLVWMYNSKLYSKVVNRSKQVLEDLTLFSK